MRPRHLSAPYYRPSWQGGDIRRPYCQSGKPGFICDITTNLEADVTCARCKALLAMEKAA